jgi:hypothetical protein
MASVRVAKKWCEVCTMCSEDVGHVLIISKDKSATCHKCANFSYPDSDTLHTVATKYLNERGKFFATLVLERCNLHYLARPVLGEEFNHWGIEYVVFVILDDGTSETQTILFNADHRVTQALNEAFSALAPSNIFVIVMGLHETDGEVLARRAWENIIAAQLQKIATGNVQKTSLSPAVSNQVSDGDNVRIWKNLRFRSESEVRIAAALDKISGVMFLPNCKARVGRASKRLNREPDFLICYKGKWGILEVDGEPSHPPTRTTEDHERDRLFRLSGVQVVEHYDAAECFENPDKVVQQFLYLLSQSK